MLIAYFVSPPKFRIRSWLILATGLIFASIAIITGFSSASWSYLLGGAAAFVSTVLVFKTGTRGRTIAAAELFLLGLLYFKMLAFSRASEAVARESSGIAQAILFLSVGAFLLHGLVLYFAAYRQNLGKHNRRELALFFALAVPVGLVIAFLLPPSFVGHSVVFNRLKEPPKPTLMPLDGSTDGLPGGNLRSDRSLGEDGQMGNEGDPTDAAGEREGENGRGGRQNSLEGYPGESWGDQQMGEGGESKQYAVMVVASAVDPVYAADGYFQSFDRERGFVYSDQEKLNELTYIRLLETWQNGEPASDQKREAEGIFFLSTIPKRVLAYEPLAVQPTVLNRRYHPFSYSYASQSAISATGKQDWAGVRELNSREREELADFLSIPLTEDARSGFSAYLDVILKGADSYHDKIAAILQSFGVFQYEIGFDDDVAVAKMERFLFETRNGDCTEFSNTTGILARLAGIPARVVTGYLAFSSLQTPSHRRGVQVLMESVEPLKQFPAENLYLVTTAHRHSWVQFFLPGYGWVDFETTEYAMPPMGGGDPNSMDVVIPIIQEIEEAPIFEIPWFVLARVFGFLLIGAVVGIYLYRYVGELYLVMLSRSQSVKALKAMGRVLLLRLAGEGYAVKAHSKTLLEYSSQYSELGAFADMYTALRYKERYRGGEWDRSWQELRNCYDGVLKSCRRRGIANTVKRVFGLRGIYYL